MSSKRKNFLISFLKYTLSLAVAAFLFWWVYGEMDFKELLGRFREVNFNLVAVSFIFALISYLYRAYRWNILLEPLGYDLNTFRTFLSLMVGYFANMLVPRLGEVTRCAALKRTDNVEMTSSFGSVVTERIIDMLALLLIILFGFIIEFDKLFELLGGKAFSQLGNINTKLIMLFIILVSALLFYFVIKYLLRKFKNKLARNTYYLKIRALIREVLEGLFTIRKLKRPVQFWVSTVLIWILYFLMMYILFFAFEPTSHLGLKAGLLVLIMGSLAMATPVQGGIGTFHLFVTGALLLYGVPEDEGKFFALIIHAYYFLTTLLIGGICFIISFFIPLKDSRNEEHRKNSEQVVPR